MSPLLFRSAWFALLVSALWIADLFADEAVDAVASKETQSVPCVSRDDEVWLISTRHLCYQYGTEPTDYELDVRKHEESVGWREASLSEFLALPPLPTAIYVHGNRMSWSDSFQQGWEVHESLAACCPTPAKMRFVIWTWPSDQVHGPLRDIRLKADQADNQTFLFGGFLSRLDPATPIKLIGYSYGSRIITGGLHLLAGGSLGGYMLTQPAMAARARIRVALLASAFNRDWLCPGYCHGSATEKVERLLILYNTCDPALQRYEILERCSDALALGYVGLPSDCLDQLGERVEQINVASQVGRSHDENRYWYSQTLRQEICRVLFDPLPIATGSR
jgi:hypothetical protein